MLLEDAVFAVLKAGRH